MIYRYHSNSETVALNPVDDWTGKLHRLSGAIVRVPAFSYVFALMMGALTVLGYAPYGLFLLPVLTLAGLFSLVLNQASRGRAALVAFCFGLGLFSAGVSLPE